MITVIMPFSTPFHKKFKAHMAGIIKEVVDSLLLTNQEFTDKIVTDTVQKITMGTKGIPATRRHSLCKVIARLIYKQFNKDKIVGALFVLGYGYDTHSLTINLYDQNDEINCKKLLGYNYADTR